MLKNRIKEMRDKLEWSQERLADQVGTSQTQIGRLEKGTHRLSDYWLERLAKAFNCSPLDIISGGDRTMVRIVGYVGPGAPMLTSKTSDLEEVEAPAGIDPASIVARRIHGKSMHPFEDGWLVFHANIASGVSIECLDKLCAVKLKGGDMLMRKLLLGSKPGFYHLTSHNNEPLFDQQLEWAARIVDVRPL